MPRAGIHVMCRLSSRIYAETPFPQFSGVVECIHRCGIRRLHHPRTYTPLGIWTICSGPGIDHSTWVIRASGHTPADLLAHTEVSSVEVDDERSRWRAPPTGGRRGHTTTTATSASKGTPDGSSEPVAPSVLTATSTSPRRPAPWAEHHPGGEALWDLTRLHRDRYFARIAAVTGHALLEAHRTWSAGRRPG
ncbi:DUF317 domain-containing protein [Streptomyces mirabilis]